MTSEWDGIEEFLAVYDRGRFAPAAKSLRRSPSHVSRAISRLEIRLGERLFQRNTRIVTPTEFAHAFADRCRHMVEDRVEAFGLSEGHGPPRGALKVTCSIAFGERVIAPLIRNFVEQYPQVTATLDLNNRIVDLVSENYDVAIRTGHLSDSRLIGRRVGSRKLYLCATPEYLEKHGVPSNINDLKNHICIQGTAEVWHFIADDKLVDFRPKGPLRVNSGTAVADAALASFGICQLPDFYVEPYIKSGSLVPLLAMASVPEEPIWVVYAHRQHLRSSTRLFIEMLQGDFARIS